MKNPVIKFIVTFLFLFLLFYYFNLLFLGITSPGNYYSPFLAGNLNYIQWLRSLLLSGSALILRAFGFDVIYNHIDLLVAGKGTIRLAYDCLGLGVMSFFIAFVIAYPKKLSSKLWFLISGLLGIQFLNIIRFVLLALFWSKKTNQVIDHHTIFNIIIYILIMICLYFWVKSKDRTINYHA